jgi:polysaccharide pyruvyl transferase WcaK-like protein
MKICIFGSFGNADIGDDAMLTEHLDNIYRLGLDKADIDLIVYQPKYSSRYFKMPIEQCINNFQQINPSDYAFLLVTGGGTINTRNPAGRSLERVHRVVSAFSEHGVPIFMSGQTVGPLGVYPEHDQMAKDIVGAVDVLTIRDDTYSFKYLSQIGASVKRLEASFDDAINLPLGSLPDDAAKLFTDGKKTVGLNTTLYTTDTPAKRKTIRDLVELIVQAKYRVVLIPHHPSDYLAMGKICYDMPGFSSVPGDVADVVLVNTENWRAEQAKALISKCDMCVGGRYHFVVFSTSANVPTVGMAGNEYSYIKQNGFARMYGNSDCILPTDRCSAGVVFEKLISIKGSPPHCANTKCRSFELFNQWHAGIMAKGK